MIVQNIKKTITNTEPLKTTISSMEFTHAIKNSLFSKEAKKYVQKNWTEIARVLSTLNLYTEGNKPMKMLKNYLFIQEKDYTNPDFKFRCETEYLARENLDWWESLSGHEQLSLACFKDGKMEISIPMLFETKETDQTLWKQCQSKLQRSQPYSTDWNKKGELGEQFRGVINRYTKCLSKRKSDLLNKAFEHKQQQEVSDMNVVPNNLSVITTDSPAYQENEEMDIDVTKIQDTQIETLPYNVIVLMPVGQSDNTTTSNHIDQVKLAEYKRNHPYFNWEIISENVNMVNSPETEKRNLMSSLQNEWFVNGNEDSFVSYDLHRVPGEEINWWERRIEENWSRFAQLEKGILIISIPKLFMESRGEKGEVREKLKGAFDQDNRSKDSPIQTHLTRYVKKLSKRKNDFIDAIILNNKFHIEQQTNVTNLGTYYAMENFVQTSCIAKGEQLIHEYQQYAPDVSEKSDQMEIGIVEMEWTNFSAEISN